MVFTDDEQEVIAIMVKAYREHVVNAYNVGKPIIGVEGDLDELLADLLIQFDYYDSKEMEYPELHIGILIAIRKTLMGFDIVDTNSPMYTVLEKTEHIINLRTQNLN